MKKIVLLVTMLFFSFAMAVLICGNKLQNIRAQNERLRSSLRSRRAKDKLALDLLSKNSDVNWPKNYWEGDADNEPAE